jgi:hypothetical protein
MVLNAQAFCTCPATLALPVAFESLPLTGSTKYTVLPAEKTTLSHAVQLLETHT